MQTTPLPKSLQVVVQRLLTPGCATDGRERWGQVEDALGGGGSLHQLEPLPHLVLQADVQLDHALGSPSEPVEGEVVEKLVGDDAAGSER